MVNETVTWKANGIFFSLYTHQTIICSNRSKRNVATWP